VIDAQSYYVYVMASASRTTYIGFTSNLARRVWEHMRKISPKAHTRKYNEVMLVHIEEYPDPWSASGREKQLKGWDQPKKHALIDAGNPDWLDLSADW
jgi:putative endonuclease